MNNSKANKQDSMSNANTIEQVVMLKSDKVQQLFEKMASTRSNSPSQSNLQYRANWADWNNSFSKTGEG